MAAWRAFSTLSDMLPLMSKTKPMDMGTSSLEKADFLFHAIFVDAKVFLVQAGDQATIRIGDGHVDKGHLNVHLDAGRFLEVRFLGLIRSFGTSDLSQHGQGEDNKCEKGHVWQPLSVYCHKNPPPGPGRGAAG